jgi:hypothetical protein
MQREVWRLLADERVRCRRGGGHCRGREPHRTQQGHKKETPRARAEHTHARHEKAPRMWLAQGKSFAKACDRWRGQPSHSELNNVNERSLNFMHRFKQLAQVAQA